MVVNRGSSLARVTQGGPSRSQESTFTPGCGARLPGCGGGAAALGPTASGPDSHNALREELAAAGTRTRNDPPACCLRGLKSSGPLSRNARLSVPLPLAEAWLCSKGTREHQGRQGAKGRWGTHGCQVPPSQGCCCLLTHKETEAQSSHWEVTDRGLEPGPAFLPPPG